ncbi:MAG: hypothetical protein WCP66_06245 [Methylococcales bacterium]
MTETLPRLRAKSFIPGYNYSVDALALIHPTKTTSPRITIKSQILGKKIPQQAGVFF